MSDFISSIIYMELDEQLGPNAKAFIPQQRDDNLLMLISVKVITLLAGEETFIPKELTIIPFPSIQKKALVKYISWEDSERRGNIGSGAISVLFDESNDAIFYKYIKQFESLFEEHSKKLVQLEIERAEDEAFIKPLEDLKNELGAFLKDLKEKEMRKKEEFPETEDRKSFVFKIIVCGDPSVGKTSTILRFTDNAFTRTYMPTIGVNISEKFITIKDATVKLVLWDLAGQQKFEAMRAHFYQGSEGMFLVFDLTAFKSFNSIYNWHKDITKSIKREIPIGFILGNKSDLTEERQINAEEANKLADGLSLIYFETSALNGKNVNDVFYKMAESILKQKGVF